MTSDLERCRCRRRSLRRHLQCPESVDDSRPACCPRRRAPNIPTEPPSGSPRTAPCFRSASSSAPAAGTGTERGDARPLRAPRRSAWPARRASGRRSRRRSSRSAAPSRSYTSIAFWPTIRSVSAAGTSQNVLRNASRVTDGMSARRGTRTCPRGAGSPIPRAAATRARAHGLFHLVGRSEAGAEEHVARHVLARPTRHLLEQRLVQRLVALGVVERPDGVELGGGRRGTSCPASR